MSAVTNHKGPDSSWLVMGKGAALLMIGRIASAACGLVQVPLALAHLGTEAFGFWMALVGFLWTGTILDAGLGFALQNRLATLLATGRQAEAGVLARRGLGWLLIFSVALILAGLPAAFFLPWAKWFGVTDPALRAQTPAAVAVAVLAIAAGLPAALFARIASALQETWRIGFWSACASVASLAAVCLAIYFSLPLFAFVLASSVLPLGLHLGLAVDLWRRCGWLRPSSAASPVQVDVTGVARESAVFFMPQVGAAFISAFVPTLVALFAGPAAVAPYSVLQRLFGVVLQLQSLGLQPTWPAYTHAAAQHDGAEARRIFRLSMLVTIAGFVLPMLVIVPFTPMILHLWLGAHGLAMPAALIWTVAIWHAMQCLGQPPAMLLNGIGRNAALAVVSWGGIVLTLLLSFWLGPRLGAMGVLIALALPYALLNLPVISWQASQALANFGKKT